MKTYIIKFKSLWAILYFIILLFLISPISTDLFAFESNDLVLYGVQQLKKPFEFDLDGDNKKEKVGFSKLEDHKVIYEMYEIFQSDERKEIFRIPIGGYHKGQVVPYEYTVFGICKFIDINKDKLVDIFYLVGDENGNKYTFLLNTGSFHFKIIDFEETNNFFRKKTGVELWEMDDVNWHLMKDNKSGYYNITYFPHSF